MRKTVVGVIAVITASSVFSLVGLGVASAATLIPNDPPGATAAFSPVSEATAIRGLHDALESSWKAKDAAGMQAAQQGLATELAKLQTPQGGHNAMTADEVTTASKALTQNDQLGQQLASLDTAHGMSASDLPLPGLGSLMGLVQSLLATLLTLITGLLGGLPVPALPVPVPAAGPVAAPSGH